MMRLALALAVVAPAGLVLGVHHFKELNSRDDMQYLNMVAPDCECGKHYVSCRRPRNADGLSASCPLP